MVHIIGKRRVARMKVVALIIAVVATVVVGSLIDSYYDSERK